MPNLRKISLENGSESSMTTRVFIIVLKYQETGVLLNIRKHSRELLNSGFMNYVPKEAIRIHRELIK